jgi:hypothetical protein
MGTRARINIVEDGKILVSIYRQMDGYPSYLGNLLKHFCQNMKIINGISGEKMGYAANGMGCFAAQLIASMKTDIGGIYIRDTSPSSQGEEFSYTLSQVEGRVWVHVGAGRMTAFGAPGTPQGGMTELYSGFISDWEIE